jgi:hypothetical protein
VSGVLLVAGAWVLGARGQGLGLGLGALQLVGAAALSARCSCRLWRCCSAERCAPPARSGCGGRPPTCLCCRADVRGGGPAHGGAAGAGQRARHSAHDRVEPAARDQVGAGPGRVDCLAGLLHGRRARRVGQLAPTAASTGAQQACRSPRRLTPTHPPSPVCAECLRLPPAPGPRPSPCRFFRLSSCIMPWMSKYDMADLPQFADISAALAQASAAPVACLLVWAGCARSLGRLRTQSARPALARRGFQPVLGGASDAAGACWPLLRRGQAGPCWPGASEQAEPLAGSCSRQLSPRRPMHAGGGQAGQAALLAADGKRVCLALGAHLAQAGDLARRYGQRLTFHPSEFCKIAGERPDWTEVGALAAVAGRLCTGSLAAAGCALPPLAACAKRHSQQLLYSLPPSSSLSTECMHTLAPAACTLGWLPRTLALWPARAWPPARLLPALQVSIRELEVHSRIFDLMGFPPSPYNKINIHVGGGWRRGSWGGWSPTRTATQWALQPPQGQVPCCGGTCGSWPHAAARSVLQAIQPSFACQVASQPAAARLPIACCGGPCGQHAARSTGSTRGPLRDYAAVLHCS